MSMAVLRLEAITAPNLMSRTRSHSPTHTPGPDFASAHHLALASLRHRGRG